MILRTIMKLIRFCILPLALSFTVFAQKKPSYTPDQATARMTLPKGFTVTQFAAEPAVVQPFAFCFDDRGRVWVCENLNYATRKSDTFKSGPQGRIIILEDTDGDGKFDKSVVFADKMMFPEGALWHDGALYVSAVPIIWKLEDTNGDGRADKRTKWFDGKTANGCANDLHGPYLGLDGWIYWCKGAFAEQTHARPDGKPLVTRAAHIFRRRPGSRWIEPVMTGGMDNPVDVEFLPSGERFFTTTFLQHPAGGRRDGLIHAVYGGVYGKKHGVLDGHKRTGELLPPLAHLGPAAPCGLTRYRSEIFGEEYRDNLFACCFNLHKITRHELTPRGATFASRDSDFLVSNNVDFHPTDILEDADGSLLVIDTGGWYKLCCPTSQLHKPDVPGMIYRVRKKDSPRVEDPHGSKIDWQGATDQLAGHLDDERPAVRERARSELARRGAAGVKELKRTLAHSRTARARRNSIWSLCRNDSDEARAATRDGLRDMDRSVRQAAAHAAGLWRDRLAREELEELLGDGSVQVRRSAAEALGRLKDPAAVAKLLAASNGIRDRVLEHSIIYALIEIAQPGATRKGLKAPGIETRRVALIALDQMDGGALEATVVIAFMQAENPATRQTASWILSRHPEWNEALAGALRPKVEKNWRHLEG